MGAMGIKDRLLKPFRTAAPVERKALDDSGRSSAESTQIIDRPTAAPPPEESPAPAPGSAPAGQGGHGSHAAEKTAIRPRPSQEAVAPTPGLDPAPPPRPEPRGEPAPAPRAAPVAADDRTLYESAPRRSTSKVAGVLVAIEGPLEGAAFVIREGKNRLGRRPDSPDGLDDPAEHRIAFGDADPRISRVHARIFADELLGCEIESLKAENPTQVGDDKIEGRVLLADNEVVAIGRTRFRFRTL